MTPTSPPTVPVEDLRPLRSGGMWGRAASMVLVATSLATAQAASAQTIIALDGTLDLNYTRLEPPSPDGRGVTTEIRPAVTIQMGSPRLMWRMSYLFVGNLSLDGNWTNYYSNQLTFGLSSELSDRSTLMVTATGNQGGTAFQLTQGSPDAGSPAFRAQGNPNLVTAALTEAYALEISPRLRLGQGLSGNLVAPQFSLAEYNASVGGYLRIDDASPTDALGAEWDPLAAILRPTGGTGTTGAPYLSLTNSLVLSWNHDFNRGWNARIAGGAAHVIAFLGSNPQAIAPVGNLTGRYTDGILTTSLTLNYGPITNLQTATVSQSGSLVARGMISFDSLLPRQLAASAGFLRSRPLGSVSEALAPGLGDALQGDVGLLWALSSVLVMNLRYSVAYQFNQPGGLLPSLAQVFLVGVTGHYSNAAYIPPLPSPGHRVDGGDAVGFGTAKP